MLRKKTSEAIKKLKGLTVKIAVVLDETGTITEGKTKATDIITVSGIPYLSSKEV